MSQIYRLLHERQAIDAEFADKDTFMTRRRRYLANLEAANSLQNLAAAAPPVSHKH